MGAAETLHGVSLTNLDQPLFDGADATKRDLIGYLDAVADRMLPALRDRPLSVLRVRPGQDPFMQKNVPKYTPDFVKTVDMWAESSQRTVRYALCDDRATLVWFGNQRAIEYHPALGRAGEGMWPTHLIMDLDPPAGEPFAHVVAAARLVRRALADCGLAGAVKTSGAKGLHIFVPVDNAAPPEDLAAATRALAARAERLNPDLATTAFIVEDRQGKVFLDSTRAGGATVASVYSPRIRPGTPVSFPLAWDALDDSVPEKFTVKTAVAALGDGNPWADEMPPPQALPADLIAEGHTIPIARVQAMHEGKRRKRAAAKSAPDQSGR